MEVYLIRHTTPQVDKGICYGQTDLDLAASFADEQQKVLAALPSSFDLVYSSPLKRCRRLAGKLTTGSVLIDDRLMEMNFGDWEMQSWDDLPKAAVKAWMKNFVNTSPPNGESMLALQQRVLTWWDTLDKNSSGKIAVVTHAGVIRVLHTSINNIKLEDSFGSFHIDYGGIEVFGT